MARPVRRLVGVYHANGGLRGEVAYVVGKFLGTAHFALCDITHSPVRRKPAWDAMVSGFDLESFGGSVDAFGAALRSAVHRAGLRLG